MVFLVSPTSIFYKAPTGVLITAVSSSVSRGSCSSKHARKKRPPLCSLCAVKIGSGIKGPIQSCPKTSHHWQLGQGRFSVVHSIPVFVSEALRLCADGDTTGNSIFLFLEKEMHSFEKKLDLMWLRLRRNLRIFVDVNQISKSIKKQ